MPPFNFENSYRKPEEPLPQDVAEAKAHPEMVGFDESAMKRKLEEQSVFEFDENSELGTMERMAREDEIKVSLKSARIENTSFTQDFERGIAKYYEEVALRPEKSFQMQFRAAFERVRDRADAAKNLYEQVCYNKQFPVVEPANHEYKKECYIVCKEGVFSQIDFIKNDGRIDLNPQGFPGVINQYASVIVLNNNAGEISIKNSEYGDEGYDVNFIKQQRSSLTRRGEERYPEWDEYLFKDYNIKTLTLTEVKEKLAGSPGAFKDLFEQVKAQVKENK